MSTWTTDVVCKKLRWNYREVLHIKSGQGKIEFRMCCLLDDPSTNTWLLYYCNGLNWKVFAICTTKYIYFGSPQWTNKYWISYLVTFFSKTNRHLSVSDQTTFNERNKINFHPRIHTPSASATTYTYRMKHFTTCKSSETYCPYIIIIIYFCHDN